MREWLDGQAAAGLVDYDATADTYHFGDEAAMILADEDSPATSAWRLLAARRAPLVLGCLSRLFANPGERVTFDDAVQELADLLADHANNPDYEIRSAEFGRLARREVRDQIKARLEVDVAAHVGTGRARAVRVTHRGQRVPHGPPGDGPHRPRHAESGRVHRLLHESARIRGE